MLSTIVDKNQWLVLKFYLHVALSILSDNIFLNAYFSNGYNYWYGYFHFLYQNVCQILFTISLGGFVQGKLKVT